MTDAHDRSTKVAMNPIARDRGHTFDNIEPRDPSAASSTQG